MPYAVREEKYVHNAAEHPDTITLLMIPLNIGKLPSFATLLRLSRKCLPGMIEKPFCSSACECVALISRIAKKNRHIKDKRMSTICAKMLITRFPEFGFMILLFSFLLLHVS
jgi:hypothetical protein